MESVMGKADQGGASASKGHTGAGVRSGHFKADPQRINQQQVFLRDFSRPCVLTKSLHRPGQF
jgi:hypothetical protein